MSCEHGDVYPCPECAAAINRIGQNGEVPRKSTVEYFERFGLPETPTGGTIGPWTAPTVEWKLWTRRWLEPCREPIVAAEQRSGEVIVFHAEPGGIGWLAVRNREDADRLIGWLWPEPGPRSGTGEVLESCISSHSSPSRNGDVPRPPDDGS